MPLSGEQTVVILLSDKRSGSTIFQTELCRHSAIKRSSYSTHTYYETQHWLKSAVLLKSHASQFMDGRVFPNYGSRKNARTYIIDTIKGNIPQYEVPSDDRELVFGGWEALCEAFAEPVFFEKSPQVLAHWAALSLLLEWSENTKAKVKLIGLVRNPLAVQNSAEKLFGTAPEERQFAWISAQKNLLALQSMLPQEMFKLVKYEDFVANPSGTLQDVCQFVGVPHQDDLGSSIHTKSAQKWRSDEFNMTVHSSLAIVANAFGYNLKSYSHDDKPEESVDRHGQQGRNSVSWLEKAKNRLINAYIKPILLRRKWK